MKKIRVASLYKLDGVKKDVLFVLDEFGKILEKSQFDGKSQDYIFLDGTLFPTFVNAHTHLELTDFENSKNISNLWDWILFVVGKKRSFSENEYIESINRGEQIFLSKGIGCIGDVRSVLPEGPYLTYFSSGRVFFEILGYSEELFQTKLSYLNKFISLCNVDKGISIHSLYTTPFSRTLNLIKRAKVNEIPVMIHLGETKYETALFFDRKVSGFEKIFPNSEFEDLNVKSYKEIIEKMGFDKNVILVHCVEFNKRDWDMVKERDISVVLCPCSNQYWGDRLPDFKYILENKIRFAIGTDSPLTNRDMNLRKDSYLILKSLNFKEKYFKQVFDSLTYVGREVLKIKGSGLERGEKFHALFVPGVYDEKELFEHFFNDGKIYIIDGDIEDDKVFKKQI
ncbi:MAG: amidohydrolase family protein [Proteobacteria bacterium]|nr:amidohydrolase family protein [Pseudomonadota bacterium]